MTIVPRLALVSLCAALALAGCGGSEPDPTVEPAADHDAQIERLRKRKAQLKRNLEKAERVADPVGPVLPALAALPGQWGLVAGAPGTGGPEVTLGEFTTGDAWSTIKVPIAERVLGDVGGPSGLDMTAKDRIHRAITLSDNDAAAGLFEGLESAHGGLAPASAAVTEMLREAGDGDTTVSTVGRDGFSTYGQTDWSLEDQFSYMAALSGGCISDPSSRSLLLEEMGQVGGSDTFGLGASGYPASWKGGWGPGTDGRYLVRQMGQVDVDGRSVVVAMAAIPDDGSFESGQAMLTRIAEQIPQLADRIPAPTGC